MARIFADLQVKDLFPTPIWIGDLDAALAKRLNADLKIAINELIDPRPQIPVGSTWQTTPMLQQHPRFAEFTALVRKSGEAALDFLDVKHKEFEITGLWANTNPTRRLNSPHTHPHNLLSRAHYVELPDHTGQIVFTAPRPQAPGILPHVNKW